MSLLKLPLLLLLAISYDRALADPFTPQPEDKIVGTCIRERMWSHIGIPCGLFVKGTTYLAVAAESIVILSRLHYSRPSSGTISRLLNALGPTEASRLSVPFVLGVLFLASGGMIRVRCFRALGPNFTFIQCIRKDHELVTTGPYTVVRHPAYSGMLMCLLGSCITFASPGSWLRASGVLGIPWVKAAAVGWCALLPAFVVTMVLRSMEEDRFLSDKFGKEWEDWARRVKYKLLPFVW